MEERGLYLDMPALVDSSDDDEGDDDSVSDSNDDEGDDAVPLGRTMLSFTIQSGGTVHTRFWCDQGPHPLGYDGGSEFGGTVVIVDEMSPVWFSDMNIDVT